MNRNWGARRVYTRRIWSPEAAVRAISCGVTAQAALFVSGALSPCGTIWTHALQLPVDTPSHPSGEFCFNSGAIWTDTLSALLHTFSGRLWESENTFKSSDVTTVKVLQNEKVKLLVEVP